MNLPFSLKLGQTTYSQVFASTNGVMSFGVADGTYWDYPNSPSISLAGYDWVTWGSGAYLRYGTTSNTLCIEWAVRPFPQSSGALTYITLHAVTTGDGNWTGEITSEGWTPPGLRRGIRETTASPIVPISSTFSVGGGVVIPTKTCWDGSVIPTTDSCPAEPLPTTNTRTVSCSTTNPYTGATVAYSGSQRYLLYWNDNTTDLDTVDEACAAAIPTFTPPPPTVETREVTCTGHNAVDNSPIFWTATQRYNLYWDHSMVDLETREDVCIAADPGLDGVTNIVVLANGVELPITVAQALQVFNSPSDLINAMFTNPAQVVTAVLNVGADMTPAQRKRAQKAMIPAVIVSQVVSATSAVTLVRR